ncbi:MAG TPA: hypothetical protein VH206_06455 [Xanthobacteraceae bacterium]|jgi:hypothetical protein|nr:hypothetical protein [Xanthobacteraceae bacterium]
MAIASSNLDSLAMVIARSPIIVAGRCAQSRLPAGFEPADITILGWIAAEARRMNRRYFSN